MTTAKYKVLQLSNFMVALSFLHKFSPQTFSLRSLQLLYYISFSFHAANETGHNGVDLRKTYYCVNKTANCEPDRNGRFNELWKKSGNRSNRILRISDSEKKKKRLDSTPAWQYILFTKKVHKERNCVEKPKLKVCLVWDMQIKNLRSLYLIITTTRRGNCT